MGVVAWVPELRSFFLTLEMEVHILSRKLSRADRAEAAGGSASVRRGGGGRGTASSRPPDSGLEGLAVAPEPEVSSWLCREPPQSGVRLTVPDGPRSASGLAGLVLKSPSLLSHRVAYVTRCCVTAACKPVASGKTSLWPLVGQGWQVVLRVWAHTHGHGQQAAAGGGTRPASAGTLASSPAAAPPQCALGHVVTAAGRERAPRLLPGRAGTSHGQPDSGLGTSCRKAGPEAGAGPPMPPVATPGCQGPAAARPSASALFPSACGRDAPELDPVCAGPALVEPPPGRCSA